MTNIFAGKVVLVTGAGSGIGRGIALGFGRDGAEVVGFGRTRRNLEETAQAMDQGNLHIVVGDVSRADDIEQLFTEIAERYGRVDILIANAALYPKTRFLDASMDEWARVIETNVVGVARCCHAALPGMLERGYGRIITLGSLAWKKPISASSAYSASKGAVRAFTRALASEIERTTHPDVLVNELLPGIVRTSMSEIGDDPAEVYQHAQCLVNLPSGGPTGQTFLRSELYVEDYGLKARARRMIAKLVGRT